MKTALKGGGHISIIIWESPDFTFSILLDSVFQNSLWNVQKFLCIYVFEFIFLTPELETKWFFFVKNGHTLYILDVFYS